MRLRRFAEPVFESLVKICGYSSGFIVLLMVVFLFKEGITFFSMSPVEEGFVLLVHKENPVKKLTTPVIKDIFDRKITNWQEVGGKDQPITLFTLDEVGKSYT